MTFKVEPITCRYCRTEVKHPGRKMLTRGICDGCFDKLQLPPEERGMRRKTQLISNLKPNPPSDSTRTIPGSFERIMAYSDRFDRGEAIFHPDDATLETLNEGD